MNTGRALVGITFVALGALFLFDQAGVIDAGSVIIDWWPVLFLVAAALELLARPPRPIGAGVFAVIGLVLLAATTDLVPGSVLALAWPLGLIALGGWLLMRRGSQSGEAFSEDRIDTTVLFAGRKLVNHSHDFRGGSATAVFGGIELDLTGAQVQGTADMEAVAVFGAVEVTVPPGWRVLLDGPAIFGGHENNAPAPADPEAPTLRVRATSVFGGVEVTVGAGWPVGSRP